MTYETRKVSRFVSEGHTNMFMCPFCFMLQPHESKAVSRHKCAASPENGECFYMNGWCFIGVATYNAFEMNTVRPKPNA